MVGLYGRILRGIFATAVAQSYNQGSQKIVLEIGDGVRVTRNRPNEEPRGLRLDCKTYKNTNLLLLLL